MNNKLFLKNNNRNKPKLMQSIVSSFLLVSFVFLTILTTYAYFTAKASTKDDFNFGTISVNLLDSNGNTVSGESFATRTLTNIIPGSTIDLSNLKVSNNGSHDEYVLINMNAQIISDSSDVLEYSVWYNTCGEEVEISNFAINTAKATFIKSYNSVLTNIKWQVPGTPLTSDFIGADLVISVAAFGVQALLPEAELYENKALYASYFICKNAEEIITDTNTIIPYKSVNITSEPCKVIKYKNLINTSSVEAFEINSQSDMGYGFKFDNLIGAYVFSFSGTSSDFYYNIISNGSFGSASALTNGAVITVEEGQSLIIYATDSANWSAISNVQLEKGSVATEYEEFRTHKDEVDYVNSTFTKNIKRITFDGTENWQRYYASNLGQMFTITIADKLVGDKYSKCSHFVNTSSAWAATYFNSYGIYAENTDDNTIYFRQPNANISTLDLFKEWLANEYEKGSPVTLAYKVASPTTETYFTSKNLYSGAQKLNFDTSTQIADSTDENATINITDVNLVKFLANKNFAVSALIKINTTDKAKIQSGYYGFDVNITYINNINGNKTTTLNHVLTMKDYGKFLFVGLNNSELISAYTSEQLNNVTAIEIELRAFNSSTYSSFEIKNIQLELGLSPTDFEAYDATEYARVNGVALRQVNGVKDTYNGFNNTITRRVGKMYLIGAQGEQWQNHSYQTYKSYKITIANKKMEYQTSICSHFANQNYAWTTNNLGTYSDNKGNSICYFIRPDETITELTLFTQWLANENEKGLTVTLWYQLDNSTTEIV